MLRFLVVLLFMLCGNVSAQCSNGVCQTQTFNQPTFVSAQNRQPRILNAISAPIRVVQAVNLFDQDRDIQYPALRPFASLQITRQAVRPTSIGSRLPIGWRRLPSGHVVDGSGLIVTSDSILGQF